MSEQRLSEWAAGASFEDKCDVLMQLVTLAVSNSPVGNDPSEVFVGADNLVRVERASGTPNLAWQAPEILQASGSDPLASAGSNQRIFTVGLMGYWLLTGADYYAKNKIDALGLGSNVHRRSNVITEGRVAHVRMGPALVAWTSVDPTKRMGGMDFFFTYLADYVTGTVRLSYVCRGTVVHVETRESHGVTNLNEGDVISAADGSYRVKASRAIPYRPGTHSYKIEVTRVEAIAPGKVLYVPKAFYTGRQDDFSELVRFLDLRGESVIESIRLKMSYPDFIFTVVRQNADGSTTNLGTATVPKPQGYGGTEYVLTLLYDQPNHALYARSEDLDGHMLDGRNLGSI